MNKRIVSILLCVTLLLGFVGIAAPPKVHAATVSQNNIVARADYLYGLKWTCQQTVTGWRGSYTFSKGSTYRLPYGQPIDSGKYIGFGVTISNFLSAANTKGSVFYTSRSTYSGNGSSSVYYAIDCSAFVSWCWGISRKTTYSLQQVSTNLGAPKTSNISKLQLGDALNSQSAGHVVLVTGLTYSGSSISKIEITEQTPPQLKRSTYTPSELASKYSGSYSILRYSGDVPAAPGASVTGKYFPACDAGMVSITNALTSIGVDSSKEYRTIIAAANGIADYSGTEEQNIALLDLLKAGLLINPEYQDLGPNVVYYPACDPSCITLIEGLNSIGVDSSKEYRTKIAAANGITDYSGTEEQNLKLFDLLQAGKLINPEPPATPSNPVYFPACGSDALSIVSALNEIGVDSSKEYRTKIAAANGISDYTGTAEQNIALLDLMKAGKLINPEGAPSTDSGNTGTGTFANGYENGYTGGMAGDGKIYAHGLDVSSWDGASLDFNAIKNAGYSYVILRAGTTNGKDQCFETYYTNARAAGLHIGAYYYSYATTVAESKADADDMLSWIKGKTFEYPVYFDYEDPSQDNLSTTTAKNICLTFCDAMAEAGYLTGVYTGYSKSTNLPMNEICAKYEVWIARYYDETYESLSPTYSTKYGMYQYTESKFIGSKGPFDANVSYKDYPAIVKQYGFNGYASPTAYLDECTVYPTHCAVSVTNSTPLNTLPRSTAYNGSKTIVQAEVGQTYIANALYCNTAGNYWYQVTLETGETAYLYSGDSQYQTHMSSDITLYDAVAPATLDPGSAFDITGTMQATLNRLDTAEVQIYQANGTLLMSATAPIYDNQAQLHEVTLDFASLNMGSYIYKIVAKYSGYYPTAPKEITEYHGQAVLLESNFTVSLCEHSFSIQITQPETCTTPGILEQTCTICGVKIQSTIIAAGHNYATEVTEPTCTEPGFTTYTCHCGDTYTADEVDALGHSYDKGVCDICGENDPNYVPVVAPTITLKTPTLLLEDTIKLNIYYSIDQHIPLEKMGMMTWKEKPSVVDISTADAVYPGATFNTGNGFYGVNTDGIPAQNLGDVIYFCIYAELEDGSIVYGKQVSYSPSTYAYNQLRGNATPEMKALLVAILNYGAAAQNYLGYKTDSLVNADLNASMQALVLPYNSSMLDSINPADSNKVGPYAATGGFAKKYPTVLLDGAFAINYHFNPSYTPDAGITLFYWTEADYNAATSLNPNNATGRITMTGSGEFEGIVEGIAAKDLDDTIYVTAGYRSGGVSYCTGILPYSIGAFCVSQANTGNELLKPLAQSIAVYGYYADIYFAL